MLNVSRPFLIRLLEEETIAYRKMGTHPRLRLEDVMKYREHTSSARWCADIQRERADNLLAKEPHRERAALERSCERRNRHVLAAAIVGRRDMIVTQNLEDFLAGMLAPFDIDVQHPGVFLHARISLASGVFCTAVRDIRNRLRNPPYAAEEYLDTLVRQELAATAAELQHSIPGSNRNPREPCPDSLLVCGKEIDMAGGWSRDGAVQDQIDDTVSDAVRAARARMPAGESNTHCEDCGARIPDRRREALPGVRTCVRCQSERDKAIVHSTINRRGSKDSQLR